MNKMKDVCDNQSTDIVGPLSELPDVQVGFRKGRGTRDQIANIHWIIEKAREFQKDIYFYALLTMPKPLTVWITINCGKF